MTESNAETMFRIQPDPEPTTSTDYIYTSPPPTCINMGSTPSNLFNFVNAADNLWATDGGNLSNRYKFRNAADEAYYNQFGKNEYMKARRYERPNFTGGNSDTPIHIGKFRDGTTIYEWYTMPMGRK